MTYECFFDGSHRKQISGCAYHIRSDNQTIHEHVHHEKLASGLLAEMRALYLLMRYVRRHIEPGSTVNIYGDAGDVLRKAEGLTKGSGKGVKTKVGKTRELLKRLRNDYTITLHCIPRKENKTAHKLARTMYPRLTPKKHSPKNHTLIGNKTMSLSDIILPGHIKYGKPPREEKYQSRLAYYREFGQFGKYLDYRNSCSKCQVITEYLILMTCYSDIRTKSLWLQYMHGLIQSERKRFRLIKDLS